MAFDMDLTRLPEGLTEVALASSDGYQEALSPAPPAPGNYMLRILAAGLQMKTENGQQVEVLDDKKYAQLKIDAIEIVQPEELQRKLYIFQKFPSKPFKNRTGSSRLTDLIRAHDQSLTWTDNTDAFRVLDQTVERGGTFYGYIDWIAKDGRWLAQEIERLGGMPNINDEERNRIFSAWKCEGKENFPVDDRGNSIPAWEGPSGEKIEARCQITKVYTTGAAPRLYTS